MIFGELSTWMWAGEHWLMAAGLLLVFLLVSAVGIAHWARIIGKCVLVVIRELKHEVTGAADIGREMKDELKTWKPKA
jgi:hypothetical protein